VVCCEPHDSHRASPAVRSSCPSAAPRRALSLPRMCISVGVELRWHRFAACAHSYGTTDVRLHALVDVRIVRWTSGGRHLRADGRQMPVHGQPLVRATRSRDHRFTSNARSRTLHRVSEAIRCQCTLISS
jgi:hypothetical protein